MLPIQNFQLSNKFPSQNTSNFSLEKIGFGFAPLAATA